MHRLWHWNTKTGRWKALRDCMDKDNNGESFHCRIIRMHYAVSSLLTFFAPFVPCPNQGALPLSFQKYGSFLDWSLG